MKRIYILTFIIFLFSNAVVAQPTYTAGDFKKLSWLKGKWEGSAEGEQTFYEEYKFLNDSTIAMLSFKDKTFSGTPDTGWVVLQKRGIIHRSGKALWRATALTAEEITFEPVNASNRFTWMKATNDQWEAILKWNDKTGKSVEKTYRLKRIR